MKNSFDKKVKESLENFEMPYDANGWASIEEKLPTNLNSTNSSSSLSVGWKSIALLGLILAAVSTWYVSNKSEFPLETNKSETSKIITAPEPLEQKQKVETLGIKPVPDQMETTNNREENETIQEREEFTDVDEEIMWAAETKPSKSPEDLKDNLDIELSPQHDLSSVVTEQNTEPIIADFVASSSTICLNEKVSFINKSTGKITLTSWEFGDGTKSSDENPTHRFSAPGSYVVKLVSENETKSVEKRIEIKVNPIPDAAISAEMKLSGYEAIPLYSFNATVQPNETAHWTFSDGTQLSGNEATHLFRNAGIHKTKLTVTNEWGCSTSTQEEVQTNKFNLLAPTAFTPSGDGINETFIPKALPEMGIAFEMTIQNPKTGLVVFRTESADSPWNGTLNNSGVELEKGLYVWTVVLKDKVSSNRVFSETIQLRR